LRCFASGLLLFGLLNQQAQAASTRHFDAGSSIPAAVTVSDAQGKQISLLALFAAQPGNINVLYIFGGGDMGTNMPGHLWCQDSFEDTHILRTLFDKYRRKNLGFVAVAAAPVYHSGVLRAKDRVFLDAASNSADFRAARQSFVESTLAAQKDGILPFTPHFDARFSLLLNPSEKQQPGPGYGAIESWYGAFRAADETQFYGVPTFWLIDDDGKVLTAPFRGNVYHPHGNDVRIRYTYSDIETAIDGALAPVSSSAHSSLKLGSP
jgi:hypothetical protein